jgi:hypothetical protein
VIVPTIASATVSSFDSTAPRWNPISVCFSLAEE